MNKILIVDTLTLSKDNKIYGHFHKTAIQFSDVLSAHYDVKIVGGKTYAHYFSKEKLIKLPFITKKAEFDSNNRFIKLLYRIKSVINTIYALLLDADVLIFQDSNQTILYNVLRYLSPKKKIILIKYSVETRDHTNEAYQGIKKSIYGVITSLQEVADFYDTKSLIIPDYFPTSCSFVEKNIELLYDFLIVGTITEEKDYVDVIRAVSNTDYSLVIVGWFKDKDKLQKLQEMATSNIQIMDCYLSEEDYLKVIYQSRYIVLPYKEGYKFKSSGVVLDAIYNGKPVVVPRIESFSFVEYDKLGIVYHTGFHEAIEKIDDIDYGELILNAECFTKRQKQKEMELIDFIRRDNNE